MDSLIIREHILDLHSPLKCSNKINFTFCTDMLCTAKFLTTVNTTDTRNTKPLHIAKLNTHERSENIFGRMQTTAQSKIVKLRLK